MKPPAPYLHGLEHAILGQASEPVKAAGKHCDDPFPCAFLQQYCQSREHPIEYPVAWLPNVRTRALKTHIAGQGITDLRQVPNKLLNPVQQRVKGAEASNWHPMGSICLRMRQSEMPTSICFRPWDKPLSRTSKKSRMTE